MRVTYDAQADAAYLYLVDQPEAGMVARTEITDVPGGIVGLDFGHDGKLLGVEVIGARDLLPAAVLDGAEVDEGTEPESQAAST